jgi:RHS repeat-associated protein
VGARGRIQNGAEFPIRFGEDGGRPRPDAQYRVLGLAVLLTSSDDGILTTKTAVHDRAGNLVFDGRLLYQYDGFNRLVQVNEAGTLVAPADFETGSGKVVPTGDPLHAPGPKLAEFVYDGLGRLIHTTRYDRAETHHSQVEEYYYGGVRRIQEIEATYEWDPELGEGGDWALLGSAATRDYVWGPGYVDEIVCQIADPAGTPIRWYYLQDGNFNVVAATDAAGQVARQYAWEPYGQVAASDQNNSLQTLPTSRIGHQGLFFERFYWQAGDDLTAAGNGALLPDDTGTSRKVVGLYHNRNRWYSPELGRFASRDPHATALDPESGLFDPTEQYIDGLNIYMRVRDNPFRFADPAAGMTMEIAALGGFAVGYIAASQALNGTLGLGGTVLAVFSMCEIAMGAKTPLITKPGVAVGQKVGRWLESETRRLYDWATRQGWGKRWASQAGSELLSGASAGIAHCLVFAYGEVLGMMAATLDAVEADLGW